MSQILYHQNYSLGNIIETVYDDGFVTVTEYESKDSVDKIADFDLIRNLQVNAFESAGLVIPSESIGRITDIKLSSAGDYFVISVFFGTIQAQDYYTERQDANRNFQNLVRTWREFKQNEPQAPIPEIKVETFPVESTI